MEINLFEKELTEEEIQKLVSSVFDSVNLINNLNGIVDKTKNEISRLNANIKHLEIVSKKDWFITNLTPNQKSIVESIIYKV